MAEQITLGSPVGAVAGTGKWIVEALHLKRGYVVNGGVITATPALSSIKVELIGEHGHRKSHVWSGTGADADIVALNKVNLTTNTLNKRILDRLIADGVIAGTSGGSAD